VQYKKTKIIATIGPASEEPKTLERMIKSGMDLVRLNYSHGNNEEKIEQIKIIKSLSNKLGKPVGIIADLAGPKLRLGQIEGIQTIKRGQTIVLSALSKPGVIPLQYDFSQFVRPEQNIYLNDGLVTLHVKHVTGKEIETVAVNSGWISSNKGVNLPDTTLPGQAFTPIDRENAVSALEAGVNYLALSFVDDHLDIVPVRELVEQINPKVKIIVKIERKGAVKNLEKIVRDTDAIMVARGDLAIETSPAEVPVLTQHIVRLCRKFQKPVIIATEMLESMTGNPRPTRAEASDVAAAVLIQADAVMLSGETARGKYPVETVQTMRDIILTVERSPEYKHYIKTDWEAMASNDKHVNALLSAAATICYRTSAPIIAIGTTSGRTARMISSFKPNSIILCATHDEETMNQTVLIWGSYPIVATPEENGEKFSEKVIAYIRDKKLAKKGETVIFIGGTKNIGVSGSTDMIKLVRL